MEGFFGAEDPDPGRDRGEDQDGQEGELVDGVGKLVGLEPLRGFERLVRPVHHPEGQVDVDRRTVSGADVEVDVLVVVADEVGGEGEHDAQLNVGHGEEESEELVQQTGDQLPLEDEEVLHQLPDQSLGDAHEVHEPAGEHDDVTGNHGEGTESEESKVARLLDGAADYHQPAEVARDVVQEGLVLCIRALVLVPQDGEQEGRAQHDGQGLDDDGQALEAVELVIAAERIERCHCQYQIGSNA